MRLTEEEFERLMNERKIAKNRSAHPSPYVERPARHEPLAKKKSQRPDKKYRIHVCHRTNREADTDGRSIKATLDGIVIAGILPDDSAKFIKEITQSQEKIVGDEETIITITEID